MKTLYLVRHALPEHGSAGGRDDTRKLTEDGQNQARQMGDKMKRLENFPQHIFCSTATRTRETLEHSGLESEAAVTFMDHLYLPSLDRLRSIMYDMDIHAKDKDSVMLLAHYPGVLELSMELAGSHEAFTYGFPECSVAVFESTAEEWSMIDVSNTKLKGLHTFNPPQNGSLRSPSAF